MKLEDQVLTIEQMNHLKEVGVEVKDTAMAWYPPCHYDERHHPYYLKDDERRYNVAINEGEMLAIPTLTLQEILEMLPRRFEVGSNEYKLEIRNDCNVIYYTNVNGKGGGWGELWGDCVNMTILDAAYSVLCFVAENGYLNKE